MTVRISARKASVILRHFYAGLSQSKIAKKTNINQGTVSLWVSRFRELVDEIGLLGAGKEFSVFHEVDELRSLAVELRKLKISTVDALYGLTIIQAFQELGIDPDKHIELVKLCAKIEDPKFVEAAIVLVQAESDSGINYEEAVSRYQKAITELPNLEALVEDKTARIESLKKSILDMRSDEHALKKKIKKLEADASKKEQKLKSALQAKAKKFKVTMKEVETVSALKAKLPQMGLDISTLIKMAKEFSDGQ